MGAQKTFFCVKFPKTKPKTIFFSPKRLFQVFRLSTREMSLCNLALFENAQNLRDKFWNLVCENRVLASKRAPFCFWRVFRSVALRKKFDTDCDPLSWRNLAFSVLTTDCLHFDRFFKDLSKFMLKMAFSEWKTILKFVKIISRQIYSFELNFEQSY